MCATLSAQIRFKVKDIRRIYEGNNYFSVNLNIFVWNLGSKTQINSLLQGLVEEWRFRGVSTSYYEEISDFYIIYKNPNSGALTPKIFPASITIKTIFDNYIPMDSPQYELPSTGADSGQEWNILYTNLPKGAFDIHTKILGEVKQIADLPGVEEKRKEIAEKNKKLLEEAERLFDQSDYKKSIAKYTYLFFVDPDSKIKHSHKVAEAYYQVATKLESTGKYSLAIENFDKAVEYNKGLIMSITPLKADCYLRIAEDNLNREKYDEASQNFRTAYNYDNSLEKIIYNRTSIFKKSPLTSFYSIIPGLGQIINGKTTKGIIHLGTFSLISYLGISTRAKANEIYDDYKLATNAYMAETLYKDADDKLKQSDIYFGVSMAVIIYSIIDNYTDVLSFNNLFELTGMDSKNNLNYRDYTLLNIKLDF